MRIITYDCEVFAYDWVVVFKDKETGTYTVIHNDNEALKMSLSEEAIHVGFNSKHYDQFIIKAIAAGFTPAEIKQVNDYIIGGGQGWEYPALRDIYFSFQNVDIRDDMQVGLSLKAIEGHIGLPIRESNVDFNIGRPLTKEEIEETITYCKWDVDTAEKLIDLRKDYLKNKIQVGNIAGVSESKALSMTNAKLTAAILKATRKEHNDERDYKYPENLKREYIPKEVFTFFGRLQDKSISSDVIFSEKLELTIGECPITIGYGGIHGAIPNYFFEETGERVIVNKDVGSYYPHLMTICGYTSRNIPSAETFEGILEKRMEAKKAGDKATANALKLVVNTTYGAMLNQFNDLYDPLMGRSVCISGQLYLLELAVHLHRDIKELKIIQLNTDGIMVECDKKYLDKVNEICGEWQRRTGFSLEEDKVIKIAQKDVNNYIEVQVDGTSKAKGGYLVRGISTVGSFNINNNAVIVAEALKENFVNGIAPEDTINACEDIFKFQMIAKASSKYKEAYQIVDKQKVSIQKTNRVYATTNKKLGTLYKIKEDGATAKIESLPEHCIIDNENHLSIKDIDKSFYIELAKKRINDFLGIEPEKKVRKKSMATKKTTEETTVTDTKLNVYQKLIKAREMFLNSDVQKSGKNMHLSFKYFELDDIVPAATRIFNEIGLISVVNFTDHTAVLTIIDTDNPEDNIDFASPFNQISPIISKEGRAATNEMQALGSSITYMRRYLYMMALDICESDGIEANIGKDNAPTTNNVKKAPATPVERAEIKDNLTAPTENASELQIKGLKNVLNKLKEAHPDKNELVNRISVETQGFTVISKADCEKLIEKISAMLEA